MFVYNLMEQQCVSILIKQQCLYILMNQCAFIFCWSNMCLYFHGVAVSFFPFKEAYVYILKGERNLKRYCTLK